MDLILRHTALYLFSLLLFASNAYAEKVNVGFEPFPPLINEDGTGYLIDMLNSLTNDSDLTFNFQLMTYARAKKELKEQRLQLIGFTPKNNETENFYLYAEELSWIFNTNVDFFSKNKAYFTIENLPTSSIGTLIGNADFFSEITKIPRKKFVEVSSLNQLVKMLDKERIKVILFERISMITTLKKLNITDIYYQKLANVPASLAVSKAEEGQQLKIKLDKLLNSIDNDTFFKDLSQYNQLANDGILTF